MEEDKGKNGEQRIKKKKRQQTSIIIKADSFRAL